MRLTPTLRSKSDTIFKAEILVDVVKVEGVVDSFEGDVTKSKLTTRKNAMKQRAKMAPRSKILGAISEFLGIQAPKMT
uniref:Uncharacterized protein n=1 Tax=Romanomermis culicivorax TaxID=13658 RepID=A0A915J7R9_ROMCU